MTPTIKPRKRTKAFVITEVNRHLLDNDKSVKNPWKLATYSIDLDYGDVSAILEQQNKGYAGGYAEDEIRLFEVEGFPNQCGAIVFGDLLPDRKHKASLLLEHLLKI